ncbi:MAG: acylphosphatase [Thermodesulfobacteriota bacterium]
MAIRAHLRITGLVQGVAYRYATRDQARRLNITGWVRNLSDGGVEAVLEGDEAQVERMIIWCETGPPGARVRQVSVKKSPATGEFEQFKITF